MYLSIRISLIEKAIKFYSSHLPKETQSKNKQVHKTFSQQKHDILVYLKTRKEISEIQLKEHDDFMLASDIFLVKKMQVGIIRMGQRKHCI